MIWRTVDRKEDTTIDRGWGGIKSGFIDAPVRQPALLADVGTARHMKQASAT